MPGCLKPVENWLNVQLVAVKFDDENRSSSLERGGRAKMGWISIFKFGVLYLRNGARYSLGHNHYMNANTRMDFQLVQKSISLTDLQRPKWVSNQKGCNSRLRSAVLIYLSINTRTTDIWQIRLNQTRCKHYMHYDYDTVTGKRKSWLDVYRDLVCKDLIRSTCDFSPRYLTSGGIPGQCIWEA